MVNGPSPGPAPSGLDGPGQQLPAHPIQLADVASTGQLHQESPRRTVDGALTTQPMAPLCPAGTQHVGVVNEVAPSQRRGHQGQQLVSRVRPPRRVSQVDVAVDDFTQAQVLG